MMNGSVLLQTRLLTDLGRICDLSHRPTDQEVSEFLTFLSVLALSNGLRFDSTVPAKDLDPMLRESERFSLTNLTPLDVGSQDDITEDARTAYLASNPKINSLLLSRNFKPGHKRFSSDVTNAFKSALDAIAASVDRTSRLEIALNCLRDDMTGAKLLLGVASQDSHHLASKLTLAFDHEDAGASLSSLINAFRPMLLSIWAGRNGSSFLGTEETVTHIADQERVAIQMIEDTILKRSGLVESNIAASRMDFPLFGAIVVLLARRGSRPLDLVHQAIEMRETFALHEVAQEYWNLPLNSPSTGIRQTIVDKTNELFDRIHLRHGPKREDLRNCLVSSGAVATSAAAIAFSASVTGFLYGEALQKQVAIAAVSGSVWCLVHYMKHIHPADRPAAALSNAIMLFQQKHPTLEQKINEIWDCN